jgi:RNA polymerase sigma factor (TIGR02999 family)
LSVNRRFASASSIAWRRLPIRLAEVETSCLVRESSGGKMGEVTRLLRQAADGDQSALGAVLSIVDEELHARAERMMSSERSDHTLQPTALVHEAYLRLVDRGSIEYSDRNHFLAVAAKKMRETLLNHARDRRAQKRGGGRARVPLSDSVLIGPDRVVDVVILDDALSGLEERNAGWARMVELKLLGGLESREIGDLLNLSTRTVERCLEMATLFLLRELDKAEP